MAWFSILFFTSFGVYIMRNIISWIGGDIELDVDFDGDADFDVSGVLSFKGFLHFILGFSVTLMTYAFEHTHSLTAACSFPWWLYVLAVAVGLITSVCLFLLYKTVMKLGHGNTDNPDFDNMDCKIYLNEGHGKYQVMIDTPNGTFKKVAESYFEDYKPGDTVKIRQDKEQNKYIIV